MSIGDIPMDDDELENEELGEDELSLDEESSGDESTEENVEPAAVAKDDEESFSRKVQKRIDKEVGKRKVLEERLARQEAESKVRIAELQAKMEEIATRNAKADAQAEEGTLRERQRLVEQKMQTAKEDGDIQGEIAAYNELLDIKVEAKFRESQKPKQVEREPESKPSSAAPLPKGMQAWLDRNDWFVRGENQRIAMAANALDQELRDEGMRPDDPAMYSELTKRLRSAFPRADFIKDVRVNGKSKAEGPPVGGGSPDSGGKSVPSKRRVLTDADVEKMIDFGLQDTKENRAIWLRHHP